MTYKKYDTVKFDFSGGWLRVLQNAIAFNSSLEIAENAEEYKKRNAQIMEKLEKYAKPEGITYFFKEELYEIVWILLENYYCLEDYYEIFENHSSK